MAKLTQAELERHLWQAADILRGTVDAGDYKQYIFGLLFYKRLCDVWDEEFEVLLAETGDREEAADPDEHRFHIPAEHRWDQVRKASTQIGQRLNNAFAAIEDANLRLRGVFGGVDFANQERFPDARLELLLSHFEKVSLRNADVPADVLGDAYLYLITMFAEGAGKKGGEFYTPRQVVRLIVECLDPQPGMSIYDPTCGSAGMLLEAVQHLKDRGQNPRSLSLYGQEKNLGTWAIAQPTRRRAAGRPVEFAAMARCRRGGQCRYSHRQLRLGGHRYTHRLDAGDWHMRAALSGVSADETD
ncbi:N-6 DNA methylase [Phenylobacterium sp.]|uniref:type I restriction-modification system subunit M n=1 Tax=Phenylobacterium sp. TaxID=1871053 RepID=UPI0035B12AAC